MADTLVEVEAAEGIAWLTLNRPERKNAFTDPMWAQLLAALDRLLADPAVRVVVLRFHVTPVRALVPQALNAPREREKVRARTEREEKERLEARRGRDVRFIMGKEDAALGSTVEIIMGT